MAVPALPETGLDEHLLEPGLIFERGDQQGVEAQAAREAEITSLAGHADGGRFDGALNPGGHVRAEVVG